MGNKKIALLAFHNEKALGVRYLANALDKNGYEPYVIFFKGFNSEIPESATECEMGLLRDLLKKIDLDVPFIEQIRDTFMKKKIKLKARDLEGMAEELWRYRSNH